MSSKAKDVDGVTFRIHDPGERMAFTGERYVTGVSGNIRNEHYHRYLFALQFCRGRDVLDVASGEGYGSALVADLARSVIGVDIDEASVAFANRVYGRENLAFRTGRAAALPLEDASVDVVVCFETIEHITDHEGFLAEVARVLRQGGILLISTPDRRVYTEEPDYHNPFHLKELNHAEFDALLRGRFAHVAIYEQQVLEGSVLARPAGGAGSVESFSTADGTQFSWKQGLPRAPYLVAVASPQPLALPAASLLSGLSTDATEPAPMAMNERLRVAELERRLYEMDQERGYLRAMVTGARERNEIAYAEQSKARAALEQEVAEQSKTRAALEQEVVAAKAELAMRIEAIRTSTSWRLTGPLRVMARAVRRILR